MEKQKASALVTILVAIIVALVVGGIAYYAGTKSLLFPTLIQSTTTDTIVLPNTAPDTTSSTEVQPTTDTIVLPNTAPDTTSSTDGSTNQVASCLLTQAQAQSLVVSTWGACTPDVCGSVSVTVQQDVQGQCLVTAVYEKMRDDSIDARKKEAIATYQNTARVLSQPNETWTCKPGRGHTGYSTTLCY